MPALAVQLVAARRTAARAARGTDPRLGALGLGAGGAVGLVVVLAAPLLDRYLHLGGPWAAVSLGASLLPTGGTFAAQGVVQGSERFGRLALLLVVAGGTRCAGGALPAAAGWGVTGVITGTLVAAVVTMAVAVAVVPAAFGLPGTGGVRGPGSWGRLWRDVAGSSTSTAGLLTFVNLDVLLARHSLPAAASGVYAVGSLFTKVAFWGPAFLATLLYPRMTAAATRDRAVAAALGLTAGLGAAVVAVRGSPAAGSWRSPRGPGTRRSGAPWPCSPRSGPRSPSSRCSCTHGWPSATGGSALPPGSAPPRRSERWPCCSPRP